MGKGEKVGLFGKGLNFVQTILTFKGWENVEKGENAGYQDYPQFQQCFQNASSS